MWMQIITEKSTVGIVQKDNSGILTFWNKIIVYATMTFCGF